MVNIKMIPAEAMDAAHKHLPLYSKHQILIALAAALSAWTGAEHLSSTSIWIAGEEVDLPERINLPVPSGDE